MWKGNFIIIGMCCLYYHILYTSYEDNADHNDSKTKILFFFKLSR
jgi:hypothetical protein